jgi:hypothetical protein
MMFGDVIGAFFLGRSSELIDRSAKVREILYQLLEFLVGRSHITRQRGELDERRSGRANRGRELDSVGRHGFTLSARKAHKSGPQTILVRHEASQQVAGVFAIMYRVTKQLIPVPIIRAIGVKFQVVHDKTSY